MYSPADINMYNSIKTKIKKRVKSWPSAYASGQLVQQYKRTFANKYGKTKNPYKHPKKSNKMSPLSRWYKERWVDACSKQQKPCGRTLLESRKYPYCRPSVRVSKDTPMTIAELLKKYGKNGVDKMCKKKHVVKKSKRLHVSMLNNLK